MDEPKSGRPQSTDTVMVLGESVVSTAETLPEQAKCGTRRQTTAAV